MNQPAVPGAAHPIESERFPKTLRCDWYQPKLVIGGWSGQMHRGHLRLGAAIEDVCAGQPTFDDLIQQLVINLSAQDPLQPEK